MIKITQEVLDEDQAFWCQFAPKELLVPDKELSGPLVSYRFVILDISDSDSKESKKDE